MPQWRDTLAMILAAFWIMVPILGVLIATMLAGFALFTLVF